MKILEVGCGKGGFMNILKKYGYHNLYGLEKSIECIHHLRKENFQIFDDWQQIENEKFDLVIANAVFEHLPDPRQMMRNITEHLTDNGLLFITVPDADSYCKYDSAPFYYFDREHINHFTSQSLQLLASLHSFLPLSVQIVQNKSIGPMQFHYDIAGIFQLKKAEMTESVKHYIISCGKKKIHVPAEIFSAEHVFLWGIGAFAENLLYGGYFNFAKNLHLLDIDLSKQGKLILGKRIEAPETLLTFNNETSAVVITSVLYQGKIIETLKNMGFNGKYYTVYQE